MVCEKVSGDPNVVLHNSLWHEANRFAPNAGKVMAKNGMSIMDVFISYRAVF